MLARALKLLQARTATRAGKMSALLGALLISGRPPEKYRALAAADEARQSGDIRRAHRCRGWCTRCAVERGSSHAPSRQRDRAEQRRPRYDDTEVRHEHRYPFVVSRLRLGVTPALACAFAAASLRPAVGAGRRRLHWTPEKSVACSSDDGRRAECAADLRGYVVRDVDQSSRTECVVGRNWGYNDRGVWVDDGCRATFMFDKARGGDHPRSYGYREPGYNSAGEQRVKCESRDGRRNECDADLRGYRIADVREISRADCDIGRNFGYDDRGVWVDEGCRAEFIFIASRDGIVAIVFRNATSGQIDGAVRRSKTKVTRPAPGHLFLSQVSGCCSSASSCLRAVHLVERFADDRRMHRRPCGSALVEPVRARDRVDVAVEHEAHDVAFRVDAAGCRNCRR